MKKHIITALVFLLCWGITIALWFLGYADPYDGSMNIADWFAVGGGIGGLVWLYIRITSNVL